MPCKLLLLSSLILVALPVGGEWFCALPAEEADLAVAVSAVVVEEDASTMKAKRKGKKQRPPRPHPVRPMTPPEPE